MIESEILSMHPGMARRATSTPEKGLAKSEALKMLDKDSLSLGDLNPLIHSIDLLRRESVDAVKYITTEKIQQVEGVQPNFMESTLVIDSKSGNNDLRMVTRFEVDSLQGEKIELLEYLVKETYGVSVRTRTDSQGNKIDPEGYPAIRPGEENLAKRSGWYMGPDTSPTSSLHIGLFVFKDLGKIDADNFSKNEGDLAKYIVEIREKNMYQTDLVTFTTQVSSVLGNGELLDQGKLLYESYYDLVRLGLKKIDTGEMYGMDNARDLIQRGLITPLASPDLSRGVKDDPQSVLMVGVPGTGKTMVMEHFLREETGLLILPIDPIELKKELVQSKEKQTLFPRLAEVARITGKRVILHVDDIENMVEGDDQTHSTILNLMAGVKESGFFIIASTNKPEKIDPALLQPQRLGILIHCGLQDEKARYEILNRRVKLESERLGKPLFPSDEIREIILREVAKQTDYFTPRYLVDIPTHASSFLIDRVRLEKGTSVDLTEEDLEGHEYDVDDWDRAYEEVSSMYDKDSIKSRDDELKKFVKKHLRGPVGFAAVREGRNSIFSQAIVEQIAAIKNLEENKIQEL